MRIGIDARPLSKQRTGIGNYVQGLVELLPETGPQHEYFLYGNREIDLPLEHSSFHSRIDSEFGWCPGAFWLLGRGASMARRDVLDVYWATNPILPLGLPSKVFKVVTVYDMIWLRCPETSTRYNILVQTLSARRAIAQADMVVAISRSTQDEMIELLKVPREKTCLVYPGISHQYRPLDQAEAAAHISHKYSVPPRYLATVGIVHPRKNQQFLVGALRILKNKGQLDCPLLLAGPIGWKNSSMFKEIEEAGLTEDIKFLGYIPDEDMPSFYAGAQAFLFPTLYEGFGLPPVEAMACGAPVIASNAPCMPEVLGDAALLEPLNHDLFATAIRRVLTDHSLRAELRTKGIERSRRYRNEVSVKELLKVFENGAGRARLAPDPRDAVVV
jgi:glycosyltransferase involved in cell wall biosynthesis